MTTAHDIRNLITLLESVDTKINTSGVKIDPSKLSLKDQQALDKLEQQLSESMLDEDWKKTAGALAVAAAAMFSTLSHAADPAGLMDQSSPSATFASCAVVANTVTPLLSNPQEQAKMRQVSSIYSQLAQQEVNNARGSGNEAVARELFKGTNAGNQTRAKIQQLVAQRNSAPLMQAALQCANTVHVNF